MSEQEAWPTLTEPVSITTRATGYAVLMAASPMVDALDVLGRLTDDLPGARRMIASGGHPERSRIVRVETTHTMTPVQDAPELPQDARKGRT